MMPKQLILTLNAAEKRIQFLLSNEQGILYAEDFAPQKGGTEFLVLAIHNACKKLELSYLDITHIACVAGPGNFMGIRLTAVTVAGITRALNKEIPCLQAPLDYLQCIAANIPAKSGETVRVMTSGTKNSVHCCNYTFDKNGIPQPNGPISLIPIPSLPYQVAHGELAENRENTTDNTKNADNTKDTSNAYNTDDELGNNAKTMFPAYLVGSGFTAHKERFENTYPHSAHFLCASFDNPSIDALYRMTKQANWQKEDIVPVYLKECDALQNLDSIATQQGRNPQEAHAELNRIMNSPAAE